MAGWLEELSEINDFTSYSYGITDGIDTELKHMSQE